MLLQWPDLYYHTSEDTIDKVSEDSLKRVGWITTVAALTLANADAETAIQLAQQTATRATSRISDALREATEELFKKKQDPTLKDEPDNFAKQIARTAQYYKNKIEHVVWREQQAVKSVSRLAEDKHLSTFIDSYCEDLSNQGEKAASSLEQTLNYFAETSNITIPTESEETEADKEAKKLTPKRQFKGTLDFTLLKKALGEKEFEWYQEVDEKDPKFSIKSEELLNFIDGKRTTYEIVKAVSAEYGETSTEQMLKFLQDLEKAKLITFS
jgi:hypothetical protein